MVHYAGYTPRFHPSDFARSAATGSARTGPSTTPTSNRSTRRSSRNCRSPGRTGPGATRTPTPTTPHPVGGNGEIFLRGAKAAGIQARVGPVAIPNGRFGNRPHCIYRGFCLQGCKVNAKASPLITHIPDALAHGAEIRPDSMVTRVVVDDRTGAVTGVNYLRAGRRALPARPRGRRRRLLHRNPAAAAAVGDRAATRDGLGNEHDQVGRYLMVQGAPQTAGRFDDEIRMYKAPPPEVSSEQFYETDPTKPYQRGWSIQTVSPLPITWAEHVTAQGHWGAPLREYMRDYVHWATLGALCEYLPQPDNRVTLAEEKDRHGLPVAHFSYSQCDNDKQLTKAATASMETILQAAGATEVMTIDRYAHLVGGARMAARAEDGVVDRDHRVFGSPEPLHRRRQHPAHPRRGQPRADHHGAGRPRRRPAHQPGPARAHRGPDGGTVTSTPAADQRHRHRGLHLPHPRTGSRRHPAVGRHHRRHRHPRPPAARPGWAGPTPARPPPRSSTTNSPTPSATATPTTSPPAGRRCTGPAATWAPKAWSCRPSAPSTSPGGTSRPACSTFRSSALLGRCRSEVPIYGSGGFTTLTDAQLEEQVGWWQSVGLHRDEDQDRRVLGHPRPTATWPGSAELRELAGAEAQLMVDANGGYSAGQARRVGAALDELGVSWFEEPVSSDDTAGLASLRAALRCDIAAGEYAADLYDVRALLPVVDCLQLDATRCGGYTGWLRGAALAQAHNLQVSAHCAPVAARLRRRRRTEPAPRRMVRRPRPPRTTAGRRTARRPSRSAAPRPPACSGTA